MFKLIKYLKPFLLLVIAVVFLLFFQAMCDLSLPDYMSDIVNVGIQQGGVENAVPEVIRKSELEKILLFLNDEEKDEVKENYLLLDSNELSEGDLERYIKMYPELKNTQIYMLNTKDKVILENLNIILGKSILITAGIQKNSLPAMNIPANVDPFTVIAQLPSEQKKLMLEKIDEGLAQMSSSMITQSAVPFIKNEYEAIGINMSRLQSNYILYSGALMLLIALLSMTATVIVGYIAARIAAGLGRNLRRNVFSKVTGFSNSEFDKYSTASLITRSTNDIQQIQMLMVMLLRIVFYAPILAIGGIIKVLNTDTSMAWIIAVAVAAILSLVIGLFSTAIPKFKIIQKLIDKLNLVTREALTGMMVIRAFSTQRYEESKFEKANTDITKTNLFVSRAMATMMPVMMLIMNGITILIVWVGSHRVDAGYLQVGNMMAFMQYAMQIIMSFLMISMVSIMLPRASVSAQRIGEVLETDTAIKDPLNSEKFSSEKKGYIEFKNVSFRYPGAEDNVLSNISFIAKPGQTTAFIGSTGSGKSTLINLIPRFYDVTEGQILIDDTDIRKVTQQELRSKIGYVPQKGILFSGTIESNLKYGDENASIDDLTNAAQTAQALEFISDKPEKFASEISQGGTNVSGGQKQRLSIARALAKNTEIYIFDDSFSALDFKTDAALRKALKEKTGGSTILIVAQRVSTIMNADQIIVLDEGKVVGIGRHDELMKNCEVYQEIALSQLSKEELHHEQ